MLLVDSIIQYEISIAKTHIYKRYGIDIWTFAIETIKNGLQLVTDLKG